MVDAPFATNAPKIDKLDVGTEVVLLVDIHHHVVGFKVSINSVVVPQTQQSFVDLLNDETAPVLEIGHRVLF